MQRTAKVTSKGQVTIPRDIRRALQIKEGDTVIFESNGDGVRLRTSEPAGVFERYKGLWHDGKERTLEEILAEIREMRGDLP